MTETHTHGHGHVGMARQHRHQHDHDGPHDHEHSDMDLREAAGLPLSGEDGPSAAAELEARRYLDMADADGMGVLSHHHGGVNKVVTSGTRAHAGDLPHEPGAISYGEPPEVDQDGVYGGSSYEVTKRYPSTFTRPAPLGRASTRRPQ
jgi:hypothetical protein